MRMPASTVAICAAIMILLSAVPTRTWSMGGGSPVRACAVDLNAMCGHVRLGGGRVHACFASHISELSTACTDKLSRVAYVAKECQGDIRRLCGGVKQASQIRGCMKSRMADVGQQCKAALARMAMPDSRNR
jgi:hypothetical protein